MSHKVDISEVTDFSNDLKSMVADLKSSLTLVSKHIDKLNAMSTFSGKTAIAAKNYFNELHKTLLKSFELLFNDLDENLKQHIKFFQSRVDSSQNALIESNYLRDLIDNIDDDFDRLMDESESVKDTIRSVSDITSVSIPYTYSLESNHKTTIKDINKLDRELGLYTSIGRQDISQIDNILNHLQKAISNAGAVSGDARFTDYLGSSTSVGLLALKEFNKGRYDVVIEKARQAQVSALKELNEPSREILIQALKDLESGKIDETQYYDVLAELRKLQNEEDLDQEVSENFIKYIIENFDGVMDTFRDNVFIAHINKGIQDSANDLLRRAELVKAMNANVPSSTSIYLSERAKNLINIGRKVTHSLTVANVTIGTYIDFKHSDKTAGQALAKNAAAAGFGIVASAATGALIKFGSTAASITTPIGLAVVGGVVFGTIATWIFNWVYVNNHFGIQDGLEWVGKKIDKAGEMLVESVNWAKEKVNNGLNSIGNAFRSGLKLLNPFS